MTPTPTTPRPDEDREYLARIIYEGTRDKFHGWCADDVAGSILAAGFTRTPAPRSTKGEVADAMVRVAADAYNETPITPTDGPWDGHCRAIRRALSAALSQQQPAGGEGNEHAIYLFQESMRDELMEWLDGLGIQKEIDGSGSDGDWTALTLSEISQALNAFDDWLQDTTSGLDSGSADYPQTPTPKDRMRYLAKLAKGAAGGEDAGLAALIDCNRKTLAMYEGATPAPRSTEGEVTDEHLFRAYREGWKDGAGPDADVALMFNDWHHSDTRVGPLLAAETAARLSQQQPAGGEQT